MNDRRCVVALLASGAALALAACGGGGNDAGVGGTVSGLAAGQSFVLQDNNTDNLTVTANGSFRFATTLADYAPYNVTILSQPTGGLCAVTSGTGQIDQAGDSVSTVAVTCTATSSVGGTVSGLAAGTAVTLSNGAVLLPVATNGSFAFPGALVAGTPFQITVATQPSGETCMVVNGVGSVTAASTSAVVVTCS